MLTVNDIVRVDLVGKLNDNRIETLADIQEIRCASAPRRKE